MNTSAVAPPSTAATVEAHWIRLPSPKPGGREPRTGLSRAAINLLILPCKQNGFRAVVKSIHPKGCGRLVLWMGKGGLKEYLENQLRSA